MLICAVRLFTPKTCLLLKFIGYVYPPRNGLRSWIFLSPTHHRKTARLLPFGFGFCLSYLPARLTRNFCFSAIAARTEKFFTRCSPSKTMQNCLRQSHTISRIFSAAITNVKCGLIRSSNFSPRLRDKNHLPKNRKQQRYSPYLSRNFVCFTKRSPRVLREDNHALK